MTTVLDTNLLSELRLPNPDPSVSAWFAAQPQADIAIASFSVAEIEYGIARIPQSGSLATQLAGWLNAIVATQRILPLDADGARIFGRLLAVSALRNLIPHRRTPEGHVSRETWRLLPPPSPIRRPWQRAMSATSASSPNTARASAGIDPWTGQTF